MRARRPPQEQRWAGDSRHLPSGSRRATSSAGLCAERAEGDREAGEGEEGEPDPEGFSTLSAHLIVDGATKAIEFCTKAFGAKRKGKMGMPDGRVGQKCQSGCAWSSSQRSFRASSGSKKAIGSATWIVTGMRSSPAAAHSGSSRTSSTATSRPDASRARSPTALQKLGWMGSGGPSHTTTWNGPTSNRTVFPKSVTARAATVAARGTSGMW